MTPPEENNTAVASRGGGEGGRRGLTLLEVLVVTVLMAMVAAVTMVSLGATDQAARTMAIIGQVRDLDTRGRMLAQTSGRQTSLIVEDNRLMLVTSELGAEPEVISEVGLESIAVQLETTQRVHRIDFDRFGHSADYKANVQGGNGVRQLQVCGLTGMFHEVVASP